MRTSCFLIVISVFIYISIADLSQRSEVENESNHVFLERNVRASRNGGNQNKEKKNKTRAKKKKTKSKKIKNKGNKKRNFKKKNTTINKNKKNMVNKNKNKRNNKNGNNSEKSNNSPIKKKKKKTNPNKQKPKKKTKKISTKGEKTANKNKRKKNGTKKTNLKIVKKKNEPKDKTENKKTKVISKLKSTKVEDESSSRIETNVEARQTSSDCEATMCSMSKKFNTAQTQYKKANRIESWVKLTSSKKTKAATTFSNASIAIQESTNNGTGCGSRTIDDEAMTANSRLPACSTTAAALCDSSAEVDSTSSDLLSSCKPLLKTFIDGYKNCLKDCTSACSCMGALTQVDSSCTKFNALEASMKARKDKCISSSNEGSFGDCRQQERHTAYYGNLCKANSCLVSTVAPGGRRKYLRDLMLKKNLN